MSSSHTKAFTGDTVASESESDAKSSKPGPRREKGGARPSPFIVPHHDSIFLLSENGKKEQKEEMQKFLALPIDQKMSRAARMRAKLISQLVGGLGEEGVGAQGGTSTTKLFKGETLLSKQRADRHELKMALMKRENISRDTKHDLIFMERQKAVLELSLMMKKNEILKIDKTLAKEERRLKHFEEIIEEDNQKFQELLRENDKKSVEARNFLEREAKSNQGKNSEIKKLTAEIGAIKSELAKFEEILSDYKRYKEVLFKLCPPERQEAHKEKLKKKKVLPKKDTEDKLETKESNTSNGLEVQMSSPGGERLSDHDHTKTANSDWDGESSESEVASPRPDTQHEPELNLSDPQQLLDLVAELTEQNLSLIQNSTRVEEKVEELRKSMDSARGKIEKDEEKLTQQIHYIVQRISKERVREGRLKQKVQLHISLNNEDQDVMLDALDKKVEEVYGSCVDDRMTNLSTLEKLATIESHLSLLQQSLENIPAESLSLMKKIKDSEKRSREREEKMREQREKQKERMRRYLERSLAESKKTSGRKLMRRYMPTTKKVKERCVDTVPAERELYADLFTADDTD